MGHWLYDYCFSGKGSFLFQYLTALFPGQSNFTPNYFLVVGLSTDNLPKILIFMHLFKHFISEVKGEVLYTPLNVTCNLFTFICDPTTLLYKSSLHSLNKVVSSMDLKWLKWPPFPRIFGFSQPSLSLQTGCK